MIKYAVIRMGEDSDTGPNGEFGIVLTAADGSYTTGFTGHCAIAHTHSKACAQTLLDASGRAALVATIDAYNAAQAAKPIFVKSPLPKKSVTKDGKAEQVDDTDLS